MLASLRTNGHYPRFVAVSWNVFFITRFWSEAFINVSLIE